MKIRYLGHSAVVVSVAGLEVGIDPWLEGNPLCPKDVINTKLDIIALTHGHADHASDVVRIFNLHGAKVAATYELACILKDEGVDASKLVYMNTGGTVQINGVSITLTPAFHSSSYDTKSRGTLYAGQPCGVVVRAGGKSLYHAGDTALFSDMKLIGEQYKPDLAMLPIGDCFTMGVEDAVAAAKLLGVKKVVPIHHSTFPLLTGSPQVFSELCAKDGILANVLKSGQILDL
jgi:L-ascorbate metabolism protein UlaG (beta-lactamase superfamily)